MPPIFPAYYLVRPSEALRGAPVLGLPLQHEPSVWSTPRSAHTNEWDPADPLSLKLTFLAELCRAIDELRGQLLPDAEAPFEAFRSALGPTPWTVETFDRHFTLEYVGFFSLYSETETFVRLKPEFLAAVSSSDGAWRENVARHVEKLAERAVALRWVRGWVDRELKATRVTSAPGKPELGEVRIHELEMFSDETAFQFWVSTFVQGRKRPRWEQNAELLVWTEIREGQAQVTGGRIIRSVVERWGDDTPPSGPALS
jgi:hypothetical protein